MKEKDRFGCTQQIKKSVQLYEGADLRADPDAYFQQKQAYKTLNLLMMAGNDGERVRVCEEGQKPNGLNIRRWKTTLEIMTDIFTAQCAYARQVEREGGEAPPPTGRGERGVNFELMRACGGTYAFTSTTKGKVSEGFVSDKKDPHLLNITTAKGIPYLDYQEFLGDEYQHPKQREILLPPMVKMTCKFRGKNTWKKVEGVSIYDVCFTGFGMELACEDEQGLLDFLEAHAVEAADGLDDLALNQENAGVMLDPGHVYWQWKKVFRQLVLQRMQRIHESYYGEK